MGKWGRENKGRLEKLEVGGWGEMGKASRSQSFSCSATVILFYMRGIVVLFSGYVLTNG